MPYFFYDRGNEKYRSPDAELNGYGGGSQSDYCERDINAKILKR